MNKMLKVMLPIILALVLLVIGCSAGFEPAGSRVEEPAEPSRLILPRVGGIAPDFQLQGLNGETISLSELRGTPVMLYFWATWCRFCREEIPTIQELYEEWTGKPPSLVILTIDIGESPSIVSQFMQSNNLSLPVLLDTKQLVSQRYEIRGTPTTFFIDKDGIIQSMKIGAFRSKEEIEASIRMIIP